MKKLFLLLLLAVSVFATSCSNDDNLLEDQSKDTSLSTRDSDSYYFKQYVDGSTFEIEKIGPGQYTLTTAPVRNVVTIDKVKREAIINSTAEINDYISDPNRTLVCETGMIHNLLGDSMQIYEYEGIYLLHVEGHGYLGYQLNSNLVAAFCTAWNAFPRYADGSILQGHIEFPSYNTSNQKAYNDNCFHASGQCTASCQPPLDEDDEDTCPGWIWVDGIHGDFEIGMCSHEECHS